VVAAEGLMAGPVITSTKPKADSEVGQIPRKRPADAQADGFTASNSRKEQCFK